MVRVLRRLQSLCMPVSGITYARAGWEGGPDNGSIEQVKFRTGAPLDCGQSSVWSKNSCGAPVVFQQTSEAFSTGDGSTAPNARVIVRREQQEVVFTLVIPLGVVVLGELS